MRKVLVCLLTLALVLGCMSVQAEGVLTPGTYTSTMTAMHGPMTVEVTVTDSAITSVETELDSVRDAFGRAQSDMDRIQDALSDLVASAGENQDTID